MRSNEGAAIASDVFFTNPRMAYALLGYAEGRLRDLCDPPKDKSNRAAYLAEYSAGIRVGAA